MELTTEMWRKAILSTDKDVQALVVAFNIANDNLNAKNRLLQHAILAVEHAGEHYRLIESKLAHALLESPHKAEVIENG